MGSFYRKLGKEARENAVGRIWRRDGGCME
jgi:hypothetical protein